MSRTVLSRSDGLLKRLVRAPDRRAETLFRHPGVDDDRLRPADSREGHAAPNAGVFPCLEILRGFAAVSVVVYHVIGAFSWTGFPNAFPLVWFRAGELSVDLFFVISGLVITPSLLRMIEREPRAFALTYLRRRLARIAPLHYLTCIACVAIMTPVLVRTPDFPVNVVRYLTFTHNLSPVSFGLINGANWSLGVEMQFYVLLLLATPLVRRANAGSVLVTLILSSWVYRASMFAFYHDQKSGWLDLTWFANNQLPAMLDEFGFGIALAIVFHRDSDGRFRRFLDATRWFWPIAAGVLLKVTLDVYFKNGSYWQNWFTIIFFRTMLGASWCLLALSACAISDRWFIRLTAPLRYLGTISFGIYLWHSLVITLVRPHFAGSPGQGLVVTLSITVLLAALSWHLFESQILERWGKARRGELLSAGTRSTPAHHLRRSRRAG